MKNEIDVIRDFSGRLIQADIPFMLTGSLALNYYAQPRMTRDIDVVVELDLVAADAFVALFSEDYYIAPEAVREAITHQTMFNLIHNESIIKVDCMVRKDNAYRRTEFQRRGQITIQDFETFIVSKEDLILSKLIWAQDSHSEKQLQDVRNLLSSGYDLAYLSHWTQELGLTELLNGCLNG